MNLKAISRNVGYALLVSALFMLLAVAVSLIDGKDSAFGPLLVSFLITFTVGIFPFFFVRRTIPITMKEGYVIIVLSWLLSFIFGMLPYALWGGPFNLSNAWFESVSGFTTTGATILNDIESLPKSLLFWRSATHFIGGLGVVVFLLLVIPNSSPVRLRLTNMELSSLSKGGYSTRANRTVYVFAYVYLAICVLAFFAYLLAGMGLFDAICHAFSVCATGGFSTRNLSIASFDSPWVELVTMIFMLLSSLHFGLLFLSVVNLTLKPLNNPVIKFYLVTLACFVIVVSVSFKVQGVFEGWGEAIWNGAFQALCISSTSGFAIADNSSWPMLPNIILMFLGVMCGCAGSTTGGVKADRVLIFFKCIGCQLGRILHPSSVNEVRMSGKLLRDDDVLPHVLYFATYLFVMGLSTVLCIAAGVNLHSAFAGSLSSLGNVGPAIRELGGFGNFDMIPTGGKLVFTIDMFLGRIEIYPFLAVLAMAFDRRR